MCTLFLGRKLYICARFSMKMSVKIQQSSVKSYQSIDNDAPATEATPIHGKPSENLYTILFAQLIAISVACWVTVAHVDQHTKTLPIVQYFYNSSHNDLLPYVLLALIVGYSVLLRFSFPSRKVWVLRLWLLLYTVACGLFAVWCVSALTCDPIVRIIHEGFFDKVIITNKDQTVMVIPHTNAERQQELTWPLSEISQLGPGWTTTTNHVWSQCSSQTEYAFMGVLISILMTTSAWLCFSVAMVAAMTVPMCNKAYFGACFSNVFAILVCFVTTIACNQYKWDWRIFVAMLAAAELSGYLSLCMITQTPLPKNAIPSATTKALWICIQPVLAIEALIRKCNEEEEENEIENV